MGETHCNNCGAIITGESPSGDPASRKPCPNCGATARGSTLKVSPGSYAVSGGSASFTVTTYPERLLRVARKLIDDGEHTVAVVVAHMACEISTERALTRAFAARGCSYLE